MNDPPECKQEPGGFTPTIDRNRCEGKEDCVAACPEKAITLGRA